MLPNRRRKFRPPSGAMSYSARHSPSISATTSRLLSAETAMPLGNRNPSATTRDRAVGRHQKDAANRASIGRRRQIEAEISDIGAARGHRRSCRRSCPSLFPTGPHRAKAGRPRKSSDACGTSSARRACRPAGSPVRKACRPRSSHAACISPRGTETQQCPAHAVDEPEPPRVPAWPLEVAAPVEQPIQLDLCHHSGRLSEDIDWGCRQSPFAIYAATASPRSCRDACWLPCARTPCRYRRRQTPCRSAVAACAIPPHPRCPCGPRRRSRGFPRSCGCGK